jgi:hypothetical protein
MNGATDAASLESLRAPNGAGGNLDVAGWLLFVLVVARFIVFLGGLEDVRMIVFPMKRAAESYFMVRHSSEILKRSWPFAGCILTPGSEACIRRYLQRVNTPGRGRIRCRHLGGDGNRPP